MQSDWTEDEAANLAWRQTITVKEAVVPPEVFRPAQTHVWANKPPLPSTTVLADTVRAQPTDAAFRDWVREKASLEQIFVLWSAISDLNRSLYLLDEGESAPRELVDCIRRQPGARAIFCLALGEWNAS